MPSVITVTATVQDPSGTALTGNCFLRFRLRNFSGFVPQIFGVSIVPEIQIDAVPVNGFVSQTLWPNNAITPGTTFYTCELWNQGRITSSGNYIFNGNTNLNTAVQLNAPPVPGGFSLVLENNGITNSSQSTLNLENTDGSVTITDVGGGTLNFTSNSVPVVGYMAGAGFTQPPLISVSGLHPGGGAPEAVIATRFEWLASLTFNTISLAKIGGTSNIHMIFGIYSGPSAASPGSLLWSSGDIAVPNSTGPMEVSVPSYTLSPGDYYLAMSTNVGSGGTQVIGINMDNVATSNQNLFNPSIIMCGSAANAATFSTTLTLPATLGALSQNGGGASAGWPMLMFYHK